MDWTKRRVMRASVWTLGVLGLVTLGATLGWAGAGDLDDGFGTDGIATTGDLDWVTPCTGLAATSDGGYVEAGWSSIGIWQLRRFDSDGTLDTSFGDGGVASLFSDPENASLQALALTADDEAVAGGFSLVTTTTGSGRKAKTVSKVLGAVARFTEDGDLDTDFGTDGIVRLDVPQSTFTRVYSMVVLTSGELLVAGEAGAPPPAKNYPSRREIFVARLAADGDLDTTFGTDGYWVYDPNNSKKGGTANEDKVGRNAMAVLSDGSIVIAAQSGITVDNVVSRLILLSSGGSLLDEVLRTGSLPTSVAVDADDRIVVVDPMGTASSIEVLVRRFGVSSDSELLADEDFGTDGNVTLALSGYDSLTSIAPIGLGSGGEVLLACMAWNASTSASARDVYVLRLDEDGALDTTFGSYGVAGPLNVMAYDDAWGLLVDEAGDIVVGGDARLATKDETTTDWVWYLARIDAE